jgi:O-antigen ligase
LPFGQSPVASFGSLLALFVTTVILLDSVSRLRWTLISIVSGLAFVSLHAIREWQKAGMAAEARPGWVAGDPNYLAFSLLLGLPLAFLLAFRAGAPRWERQYALACAAVMLFAFLLSSSRGGFLALGVALPFAVWRSPYRSRWVALGMVVALLVIALPGSPLSRFMDPSHGDLESHRIRLALLEAGLRMFWENLWIGVGVGNYRNEVARYATDPEAELRHVAHNTYVEVAGEQGVPGILLFVSILVLAFRGLRKVRQSAADNTGSVVYVAAHGLEIALAGACVGMLFLSTLYARLLWFLIFLVIPLQSLSDRSSARGEEESDADGNVRLPGTPPGRVAWGGRPIGPRNRGEATRWTRRGLSR